MQHGYPQRSHIKVKGHLLSWKIGWKCESGLIWKVEVWLEPNLVYWFIMEPSVCLCGQRLYTKFRGQVVSWTQNVNSPYLKSWSPIGTKLGLLIHYHGTLCMFMSSNTKVKGHQRSNCKMGSKCKIHLIWKVGSPIGTKHGLLSPSHVHEVKGHKWRSKVM